MVMAEPVVVIPSSVLLAQLSSSLLMVEAAVVEALPLPVLAVEGPPQECMGGPLAVQLPLREAQGQPEATEIPVLSVLVAVVAVVLRPLT